MLSLRQITRSYRVQRAIGVTAAYYLSFVWHTTRVTIEPAGAVERAAKQVPIILAMWHGQHLLVPFLRPKNVPTKVLISRHRDGEINAAAVEALGNQSIRGSGSHGPDVSGKGGLFAFNAVVRALEEGFTIAMTADVPKVSRVAGLGIVKIAQMSGRPIYPVAVATSRRVSLKSWDRAAINLPFSRGAIAVGDPVRVGAHADVDALETARRAIEERLDAATARAYAIVGGREDARG